MFLSLYIRADIRACHEYIPKDFIHLPLKWMHCLSGLTWRWIKLMAFSYNTSVLISVLFFLPAPNQFHGLVHLADAHFSCTKEVRAEGSAREGTLGAKEDFLGFFWHWCLFILVWNTCGILVQELIILMCEVVGSFRNKVYQLQVYWSKRHSKGAKFIKINGIEYTVLWDIEKLLQFCCVS